MRECAVIILSICVLVALLLGITGCLRMNSAPVAKFEWTATGLTVKFDAGESYDSDGTIEAYYWIFGDGTIGVGRIATHTYVACSEISHTVRLHVTDDSGRSGAMRREITVEPLLIPGPGASDEWFPPWGQVNPRPYRMLTVAGPREFNCMVSGDAFTQTEVEFLGCRVDASDYRVNEIRVAARIASERTLEWPVCMLLRVIDEDNRVIFEGLLEPNPDSTPPRPDELLIVKGGWQVEYDLGIINLDIYEITYGEPPVVP